MSHVADLILCMCSGIVVMTTAVVSQDGGRHFERVMLFFVVYIAMRLSVNSAINR